MFSTANLDHIRELHSIGRQLAVLKRIYKSYDMIIERVMNGPQPRTKSKATGEDSRNALSALVHRGGGQKQADASETTSYGVPVSTAAGFRFERLKDRINLYALSEIQDCLDEKESLVMMVSFRSV